MTKRTEKNANGMYKVDNCEYPNWFGSRVQVWNNSAYQTKGNLTKSDLIKNRWGRLVSRKKHLLGNETRKRLLRKGYDARKGAFGAFRITPVAKTITYVKRPNESRHHLNTRRRNRKFSLQPSNKKTVHIASKRVSYQN